MALQKGMAVFSMKSMGGSGEPIVHGALTPTEALSYAMSVPGVSTTISGMDSMAVLDQNLEILRNFKSLSEKQMSELREHGRQFNDGRYELFKSSAKYDGDVGENSTTIRHRPSCRLEDTQGGGGDCYGDRMYRNGCQGNHFCRSGNIASSVRHWLACARLGCFSCA